MMMQKGVVLAFLAVNLATQVNGQLFRPGQEPQNGKLEPETIDTIRQFFRQSTSNFKS